MGKIRPLTFLEVREILINNGFRLDRAKGSHFTYRHTTDGRIVTVPKKKKDMPKGTLMSVIRQSGLSKNQFTKS